MKKSILTATFLACFIFTGCGDNTTSETAKTVTAEIIKTMATNDIEGFKKLLSATTLKQYEIKGIGNLTVPGLKNELTEDPVNMSEDKKTAEVIVKTSLKGVIDAKTIWTLKEEGGEWKLYGDARLAQ